jgi:hypothetical protein
MVASGRPPAEAMSLLRLLQRLFNEFFNEILAIVPCVGREPAIDHSCKLGRIAVRA